MTGVPSAGERIAAYRAAYRAANGTDIEVVLKNGWFIVGRWPAQSKWRGKKLDEFADVLRRRAKVETPTDGSIPSDD